MLESVIERTLYAARWLLAPIYLGLSLALIALGLKFFEALWHLFPVIFTISEADLVVTILSLVDIALICGLLVMVMLGGYESFVSRIDVDRNTKDLSWLGKLDAGSIKQKLAASIVAVSAIHLLQHFVNAAHVANDKLMWYVIIHMTFVVSALAMAIMDKISKKAD